MADIAGLAEHTDLNSLVYDLRSYLKCLVQDYCKKNASFAARPPPPQPPHLKMEPIMAAAPPPAVGFPYGTVVPAHHYGPGASSSIFVNMQAGATESSVAVFEKYTKTSKFSNKLKIKIHFQPLFFDFYIFLTAVVPMV